MKLLDLPASSKINKAGQLRQALVRAVSSCQVIANGTAGATDQADKLRDLLLVGMSKLDAIIPGPGFQYAFSGAHSTTGSLLAMTSVSTDFSQLTCNTRSGGTIVALDSAITGSPTITFGTTVHKVFASSGDVTANCSVTKNAGKKGIAMQIDSISATQSAILGIQDLTQTEGIQLSYTTTGLTLTGPLGSTTVTSDPITSPIILVVDLGAHTIDVKHNGITDTGFEATVGWPVGTDFSVITSITESASGTAQVTYFLNGEKALPSPSTPWGQADGPSYGLAVSSGILSGTQKVYARFRADNVMRNGEICAVACGFATSAFDPTSAVTTQGSTLCALAQRASDGGGAHVFTGSPLGGVVVLTGGGSAPLSASEEGAVAIDLENGIVHAWYGAYSKMNLEGDVTSTTDTISVTPGGPYRLCGMIIGNGHTGAVVTLLEGPGAFAIPVGFTNILDL